MDSVNVLLNATPEILRQLVPLAEKYGVYEEV